MWVVYSMNKEDIWASRTTVPIKGSETEHLRETFDRAETVSDLDRWNLHIPKWAPTAPVFETGTKNRVLELRDEEPYDYALAERVFPRSERVRISFRVQARDVAQGIPLDIEVQSQRGDRPLRLRMDRDWLGFDHEGVKVDPVRVAPHRWHVVQLELDCTRTVYTASLDGKVVHRDLKLTGECPAVERIVFRTGPFRGWVPPAHVENGAASPSGIETEDLPGADQRVAPTTFWIDDLTTAPF
jgi:hypothetical protein